MFDSIPLTLAQASQPADEGAIKPSAPPSDQMTISAGTDHATATTSAAGSGSAAPAQPPGLFTTMQPFILIIGFVAIFMWITSASQRKEKKKRASMLGALKKGDKVQTIGGMIGSVVEVRENDVVLKVDESGNTRIRFTRGAIQTVLEDKPVDVEQAV